MCLPVFKSWVEAELLLSEGDSLLLLGCCNEK